ncbi:hypothetical protein [Robiginitomaculum antarcticum]|uniref:hypothetical protein n=1 Tax=Robiginitomaculum antarcticum TaxID=437507 RepID=UPI0003803969|nr:hypothetical protein [Robiginitomaculum antarcticum]
MKIRLFSLIMESFFGNSNRVDAMPGALENKVVAIETDGGIEPVSALKICGDSFTKMGLNVSTNAISDLEKNPMAAAFLKGGKQVSSICKACDVYEICGGGYFPHRFDGESFNNPSVYCESLYTLISSIQNEIMTKIPEMKEWIRPIASDRHISASTLVQCLECISDEGVN